DSLYLSQDFTGWKTRMQALGVCDWSGKQASLYSIIADMAFVFRVKLDVWHRRIFGGIEGWHHRFRRAEFLKVAAGVGQAEVVGVGRSIAPGLPVRLGGGGNSGLAVALVEFELCQDVERIGMKERIWPALSVGPDLVKESVRSVVVLLPVQFSQGCQR